MVTRKEYEEAKRALQAEYEKKLQAIETAWRLFGPRRKTAARRTRGR